ncbi:hypothetical protein HY643_02875 [Candidatus Woesearchaeota archaeon]|nr:hypothetical protein [Candidatus Woesearchaeota archaeon]
MDDGITKLDREAISLEASLEENVWSGWKAKKLPELEKQALILEKKYAELNYTPGVEFAKKLKEKIDKELRYPIYVKGAHAKVQLLQKKVGYLQKETETLLKNNLGKEKCERLNWIINELNKAEEICQSLGEEWGKEERLKQPFQKLGEEIKGVNKEISYKKESEALRLRGEIEELGYRAGRTIFSWQTKKVKTELEITLSELGDLANVGC